SGMQELRVNVINNEICDIDWTISDNSGIIRTYNQIPSYSSQEIYTTMYNDGIYGLMAEAYNKYGDTGIDEITMLFDNTAPDIIFRNASIFYINNNNVYYQITDNNAVFIISDIHSYIDDIQYIIDGISNDINVDSMPIYTLSFAGSDYNNKTIELLATDNCGNESGIVEYSFIQDNEIPTIELVIGEPQLKSDGKLYISDYTPIWIIADDTLSGIKEVAYTVEKPSDSIIWNQYSGNLFYLDYFGNDADTLYFRAEDNVGNSIIDSQIFYFDCTPPVSVLTYSEPSYISGDDIYFTEESQITISSTDDMTGVKQLTYIIDGQENTINDSLVVLTLFSYENGFHNIIYYAVDNAGNIEETQEFEFHIDNTPPTINITFTIPHYESDYQFVTSDALIDVIAIDNGCGVKLINYSIDISNIQGTFTDSVNIKLNTLLENTYLLNIIGYDNL
ncbi:hypothetical protein KAU15_06650, partial [candidate division WOR-3 bacterium]|nr:hypothetical protein [candidate division WOR-3 bacterium]